MKPKSSSSSSKDMLNSPKASSDVEMFILGSKQNEAETQEKQQDTQTTSLYASDHPLLNQPPFQPQQQHQQQDQTTVQHHQVFVSHQQIFTAPPPQIGFIPVYRSHSLPHIMPSYHYVPQYLIHQSGNAMVSQVGQFPPPSPNQQQYQQQQQLQQQQRQSGSGSSSESVSSVFKKTCFKCGNLGHFAEDCEFEERLCYNCKKPGHETSDCPYPRSTELKQCYICREIGHLQSNCPRVSQSTASLSSPATNSSYSGQPLRSSSRSFKRPSQQLSVPAYNYPYFERSRLTSAPASPLMGSSISTQDYRGLLQQQYINPSLVTQRTIYLQNANHAFMQRKSRSDSVPAIHLQSSSHSVNSLDSKSSKKSSTSQHAQEKNNTDKDSDVENESTNTSKDI